MGVWGSPLWYDHPKQTHKFCCQVRRTEALHSHCSTVWKDCSEQLYVSLWSITQVRGAIRHHQRSPQLLHQGQEHSCWRRTALQTLSQPRHSTCTHTQTEANMHSIGTFSVTLPVLFCLYLYGTLCVLHSFTHWPQLSHHHTPGLATGPAVLSGPVDF